MRHYTPPSPLENLQALTAEQRAVIVQRATLGGFWFGAVFAVVSLVVDLIFSFSGSLPTALLIWVIVRTILLPVAGYFLGRLSGTIALRCTLSANGKNENENGALGADGAIDKQHQLEVLSTSRAREEAKDLVPNDLPLRSTGARNFFLILLVAFLLFYPVLDPLLFGFGTDGHLRATEMQAITSFSPSVSILW